jgi:WD40 repeat protein
MEGPPAPADCRRMAKLCLRTCGVTFLAAMPGRAAAPALRRLGSGPSDRGLGDRGCVRLPTAQRDYCKLTAESRQLAADAEVNATRDPELSVLLALQALRLHYTSQAEDALRAVLPELQAVRTFRGGTTVYSAVFDPVDANKVASADRSGAWIWDVKTGHRVRMSLGGFAVTGAANAGACNPAGTEVAVGYADGKVALFDARSGRELQSANVIGSATVNDVEFVGSTGELAIATTQGLFLWQPQNRSRCCDILSREQANTIAADPRNPLQFAVVTVNGTVIWNVSGSGKPRQQRLAQGLWPTNDAAFSP